MPRVCTICGHPQRAAIDAALIDGESFRNIAERFGTSPTAVFRHRSDHLPAAMVKAAEAAAVVHADDLLAQVRDLHGRALGILETAQATSDLRTALAAIREARGCVELLAKLLGELDQRPILNLLLAPEWASVRSVLLTALGPYPEARAAVADRLLSLEP